MRFGAGDMIELRAVDPNGDLACDTTIATPEARAGLFEALRGGIIATPRRTSDGVEVKFAPAARDAVMRYVELESRCCSFLTLRVRDEGDAIALRITGRPQARDWIAHIFEQP
jgi:hypothetical protein